jgi:hypothetical protein
MERTRSTIEALVNHITLPPKLPGRQDGNLRVIEPGLIAFLLGALSNLDPNGEHDVLKRSLRTCRAS